MKEIGEKLKEARENIGISIEEAAEDLKIKPSQLINIEEGNRDAFNDIFYLKYFIRDYSKYLGLDYENMVEDFNEFLFDYTSKISIEDIKKASAKGTEKKQVKKISSPYTKDNELNKKVPRVLMMILGMLLVCILIYACLLFLKDRNNNKNDKKINNKEQVTYNI